MTTTQTTQIQTTQRDEPGNQSGKKTRHVIPQHRLKVVNTTVASLREFPGNPRKGNVLAIVDSLKQNGQYRPIVVQKSTRRVLAGNHTLQAARALGWKTIDVVYVDVNDVGARRIMLADNRTNDLASYDPELLGRILESMPDVTGTGYTDADVQALTRAVKLDTGTVTADQVQAQIQDLIHPEFSDRNRQVSPDTFKDEVVLQDDTVEEFSDVLESAQVVLPGIVQLSDEFDWHGKVTTPWQIPVLAGHNLVQPGDLPASLKTYVPRMHRDWPDDAQGWFCIARSGNTAGLKQPQNSILAFYTYDEHFDPWWWEYPARTTQMLNAGINMAVTPNWSMFDTMPRIEHLWALYRNRYIGRYWQEVGVKVIPDMQFGHDEKFLTEYILPTLPDQCPVVAAQRQNHNERLDKEWFFHAMRLFYDRVKPEVLICYASDDGTEIMRQANLGWEIIQVELFSTVMRDYKLATTWRQEVVERQEAEQRVGQKQQKLNSRVPKGSSARKPPERAETVAVVASHTEVAGVPKRRVRKSVSA